jgi:hypothetical protein
MRTCFTKRTGGESHGAFASLNLGTHVGDDLDVVARNRAIAAADFGPVQYMNQVHSDRIAIIEEITEEVPTADALVTGIPGIGLAVMVADCIPLLLHSPEVVAAVHVGRKGLVNGIALKTITLMQEMGASSIAATIGPAICGRCYEVSEDVYSEVTSLFPLAASRTLNDTCALDLPTALRGVLESLAIEIRDESVCTVESSDHFSYRRDGITGRQAGFITL